MLQKKGSGGTSLGSVFGGKTGGWKKRKFELVRHCHDDAGVDVGPVLRYYDASRAASRDARVALSRRAPGDAPGSENARRGTRRGWSPVGSKKHPACRDVGIWMR